MSVFQLTAMGFSFDDAEQALQLHPTTEAALDHLLSMSTHPEAPMPALAGNAPAAGIECTVRMGVMPETEECVSEVVDETISETDAGVVNESAAHGSLDESSAVQPETMPAASESKDEQIVSEGTLPHHGTASVWEAATEDERSNHRLDETMACQPDTNVIGVENGAGPGHFADGVAVPETTSVAAQGEAEHKVSEGVLLHQGAATAWDRAQILVAESMSAVRSRVQQHKQPQKASETVAAADFAEGLPEFHSLVLSVEGLENPQEIPERDHDRSNASKWSVLADKLKVAAAAHLNADEGANSAQVTSFGMKWRVWAHKLNIAPASCVAADEDCEVIEQSHSSRALKWREWVQKLNAAERDHDRSNASKWSALADKLKIAAAAHLDADESANSAPVTSFGVKWRVWAHKLNIAPASCVAADEDCEVTEHSHISRASKWREWVQKLNAATAFVNENAEQGQDASFSSKWHEWAHKLNATTTAVVDADEKTERGQDVSFGSKWRELSQKLNIAASTFVDGDDNAVCDSSTPEASLGSTFVNATRLDRVQVLFSSAMSAIRSKGSRVN